MWHDGLRSADSRASRLSTGELGIPPRLRMPSRLSAPPTSRCGELICDLTIVGANLQEQGLTGRISAAPNSYNVTFSTAVIRWHCLHLGRSLGPGKSEFGREVFRLVSSPDGRALFSAGGDETVCSSLAAAPEDLPQARRLLCIGDQF